MKILLPDRNIDVGLLMMTEPFDRCPCFNTNFFTSKFEFLIKDYIDFAIDCIDNNTYVYTYRYMDEFYISQSPYYQKHEMIHMFILYGYDLEKKVFYTLGYDSRKIYTTLTVTFEEFIASICNLENKDDRFMILVKHNPDHEEDLNPVDIKFWLDQYLNCKNSHIMFRGVMDEYSMTERTVFGIKTYDYLTMYLYYIISGRLNPQYMDRRSYRQLWEHKNVMLKRVEALVDKKYIDEKYIELYKPIVNSASILQNLQTKFNVTGNIKILSDMMERVKILSEDEYLILNKLYKDL